MVIVAFLSSHLVYALLAFGAAVLLDILLGILDDLVHGVGFSLAKLKDFIITSVGYQQTIAFGIALLAMLTSNQPITEAAVAGMAVLYTLKMIADIAVKLVALQPAPKPAPSP